jgi:hypothetical protein
MTLSQPAQPTTAAAPQPPVPPRSAPEAVTSGRFRKIPLEVDAARWFTNGDHPDDGVGQDVLDRISGNTFRRVEGNVVRFFRDPDVPGYRACAKCELEMHVHGWIDTLEGGHIVCPGDWIVTGVHGERYPVKPDIFDKTYERVSP